MIEARALTKRYGPKLAVDKLSFTVQPGRVTGFLGPNGAGKSTTMRLILGLDRPSDGSATINGKPYRDLRNPLRTVGALLEARSVHTGRTAFNHLLAQAQSQGLPRQRVQEVIALVGLNEVARKRTGGFSLGMSQRLGIAAALLGDPGVLLLDEPVNGLDPEGILWIRNLMKQLAAEGRTVFVSSHLMNEMSVTADHLIVIGRGRLIVGLQHQGVHRPEHAAVGPGAHTRPGQANQRDHRRRRARGSAGSHGGRDARAHRHRRPGAADRRAGRGFVGGAARAHAADGLAGGSLHGADRRQRRVRPEQQATRGGSPVATAERSSQ